VQRMSRLTDLLDKYINGDDDVNDQVAKCAGNLDQRCDAGGTTNKKGSKYMTFQLILILITCVFLCFGERKVCGNCVCTFFFKRSLGR
jgi:hypothetical protein